MSSVQTSNAKNSETAHGWHWGERSLARAEDLAWALADPVDWPMGPLRRDGRLVVGISAFEAWMHERGWSLSELGPAGCMWMRLVGGEAQAPSSKDVGRLWMELHRWGAECESQAIAVACSEELDASKTGGRL